MNRAVYVAMIAGSLLHLAATASADDQATVPAIFSVASDLDGNNAPAPAPSMILQVAAESDIPSPKFFSVSTLAPESCSVTSPSDHGSSTPGSSCEHCGNSSTCDQCTNSCNCGSGSDACGHDCCEDYWPHCLHPTWTFKGGAVVLDRVSPRSTALVVETGTGLSLMNASGFSFNWNGGVDASLIRRMGDDNALEARYFGINNWTAFQSILTSTPAEIPIFPPVPIPPQVILPPPGPNVPNVTSRFDTNLYSAEVNWHHESSDTIGWLAGFRWLSVHDALGITFPNTQIRSVTDNQLCGGQIGGDFKMWEEGGPLHIDTVLKAGLYNNNAENLLESRNQLAFVGEVGVNIVYQCCDHVALSAGYQVLWLTGLAVASDQIPHIDLNTLSGITTGGNAFYHGAMFSVNCSW